MIDTESELIHKRTNLRNLLDHAKALQRELNHTNEQIEKETRELRLAEMKLKVDQAMEELKNYPKDFMVGLKTWSRERLKILYSDMNEKEIDMLYERIQMKT